MAAGALIPTFLQRKLTSAARLHIFKPKIPIWVNFGGSSNGKCRYLYVNLVDFMATWYSLWPFGIFKVIWHIFSPFWYVVPRKIWQPWDLTRKKLYQEKSDKPGPGQKKAFL
jgi:hypothetical protein